MASEDELKALIEKEYHYTPYPETYALSPPAFVPVSSKKYLFVFKAS